MIKKLFAIIIFVSLVVMFVLFSDTSKDQVFMTSGNTKQIPQEIEFERYIDPETKKAIKKLEYSAQLIMPNGDTYYFCDAANAFIWYMREKDKKGIKIYVYTMDTERYIDAKDAWYSRMEMTPDMHGIGAWENRSYNRAHYTFEDVVVFAGRGETKMNPFIKYLCLRGKC